MRLLQLTQNTQEWHQHRATARNASDASAMMACSPYKTRAQLLQERATGIRPDVDAATQARFARGHEIEAKARVLIEEMLGQDLYPVIGTTDDGYLSASFDGITMDETTAVEIKSWNEGKAAEVREGRIPTADVWQCVHQLAVSDANVLIYVVSDGTPERTVMTRAYPSDRDRLALLNGWEQFDKDVAAWVPTESVPAAQAAPMESLPAVVVQVSGALTVGGNLDAFGDALRAFIERIPQRPETDQQFADAEAACKALKKAEDALTQAEDGALAQISDVEVMRRTVADLKELARSTRLTTEKLVKAEKDARRTEKVMAARAEFDKHVARLQVDIKGVRLIVPTPDFGSAIKGLSSLASIDDKLTAALIAGRAEANTIASRIINNLQTLDSMPAHAHLFADRQELAYKDAETLELLMQKRVDAEAARIEAERERIRQEEERKAHEAAERQAEAERSRIRAEEQQKAQAEAAEREAAARRERILAEAAKPAVTRALEAIEQEKEVAPGKPLAPVLTAAAPVAVGIAPAAAAGSAADDAPELTLSAINERLHPISLSAAGLAEFGIEPLATRKAAKMYSHAQFEQACRAIVRCATDAMRGELEAA